MSFFLSLVPTAYSSCTQGPRSNTFEGKVAHFTLLAARLAPELNYPLLSCLQAKFTFSCASTAPAGAAETQCAERADIAPHGNTHSGSAAMEEPACACTFCFFPSSSSSPPTVFLLLFLLLLLFPLSCLPRLVCLSLSC